MSVTIKLDVLLIKGITFQNCKLSCHFKFELQVQNEVGNIAILVLCKHREKYYIIL